MKVLILVFYNFLNLTHRLLKAMKKNRKAQIQRPVKRKFVCHTLNMVSSYCSTLFIHLNIGWEFGLFNLGLLLLLGATVCYQFGLFDPENIPAFVLSKEELWSQWYHNIFYLSSFIISSSLIIVFCSKLRPALAPPNFTHPVEFTRREDNHVEGE